MTLKKVIKDKVTMYGQIEGQDSCHNCISLNKDVTTKLDKSEIPIDYKHHSVYDDEIGIKVSEEKNIKEIPYVNHCKVAEDNTEKCDVVIGYDKKYWDKVGTSREEDF